MKVTYEFEPDPEKNNDEFELNLVRFANDMHSALVDLEALRRNLYKGYKYYDSEDEEEGKYSRIDVDQLLDDINGILSTSHYYDFP